MRIYRILSTALGGVFMAGMSTSAFAGCVGSAYCGPSVVTYEGVPSAACIGPAPVKDCRAGVTVHNNHYDPLANVGVYNSAPYGHLRTVEYKNSQNVNIMRVHSRAPSVLLSDAPSSFTKGCTPTSTAYCRAPQGKPANVVLYNAPSVSTSKVTYGSGYNAAAFAPRQYGSNTFVPGIAHVPTSIVDRSPITHINGVPQQRAHSVTTAAPAYAHKMHRPHMRGGNVIGSVVTGSYTYQPPGGGAYWEKTSGPTMIGGMMATQVICRREAPRPAPVRVNVVSPVIGVPTPVCAPAPKPCAPVCAPAPKRCAPTGCAPVDSRYGGTGRWTY